MILKNRLMSFAGIRVGYRRDEDMTIDLKKVHGVGAYLERKEKDIIYYSVPEGKVFLVQGPKTLEVRCDRKLSLVLRDQYESVMESRYFGIGGIEIVPSGQLSDEELADLIRLSYNLTVEEKNNGKS